MKKINHFKIDNWNNFNLEIDHKKNRPVLAGRLRQGKGEIASYSLFTL